MGKRERHRAKQERRAERTTATSPRVGETGRSPDEEIAFGAALVADDRLQIDATEFLVKTSTGDSVQGGRLALDVALDRALERAVRLAWESGWQPAEVPRFARRELTARHATVVVDAIALEATRYGDADLEPRWRGQLSEIEATMWWHSERRSRLDQWGARHGVHRIDALRCSLEALGFLWRLPKLPKLCALPGDAPRRANATAGVDPRQLSRIRALLAKAESTTFEAEAEALSAKAQELITRHSVDQALLHAVDNGTDGPVGRRILIDDPYASPKSRLLSGIARVNRCQAVYSGDTFASTVFGYETDLDLIELLYTSLLVQASSAMMAAGRSPDPHRRSRGFRGSFLLGFGVRITERLAAAADAMRATADVESGGRLLPVLVSREVAITKAREATFSNLRSRRTTVSSGAGWVAGQAAAEVANLDVRQQVEDGREAAGL